MSDPLDTREIPAPPRRHHAKFYARWLLNPVFLYPNFVSTWLLFYYSISTLTFSLTTPAFSTFRPSSESEILKILFNCPNKQLHSDAMPTWQFEKKILPQIIRLVQPDQVT